MRPSAPWMKNAQKSSADIRSIRRQISRQCCGGWSRAPIWELRTEPGSQDKGVNRDSREKSSTRTAATCKQRGLRPKGFNRNFDNLLTKKENDHVSIHCLHEN